MLILRRKYLISKIRENKTVLTNFSYLTLLQLFTLLCPLITYPYLVRVIGMQLYGTVVFAQVLVSYISLVIDFGFNSIGAKEIASNRDNATAISEIFSSIQTNKFIIWLICLIFYTIIVYSFTFFKEYRSLYLYSFFLTFNELLFPVWFFQGIEKMKYTTYINIFVRLIFLLLIFIFVNDKGDYIYIPLFNSLGALFAGLLSLYVIVHKEKVQLVIVPFSKLIYFLKESLSLFVSVISVRLYLNINKLVVGSCLGMSEVAIYDLGEKIATTMKIPIGMIGQATFPKIARERNIRYVNYLLYIVVGLAILGYFGVFLFSPLIVKLFTGEILSETISIVRILGLSGIFAAANYFLGGNRLITFGFKNVYMKVMILNSIFYFVLLSILYITKFLNIYTISIATVVVEMFNMVSLILYNKRLNILCS